MTGQNWRHRAACRSWPPDTFYPTRCAGHPGRVADAIAICATCPVRGPCLDDALTMPAHQRLVGMIRGGRYFRSAKSGTGAAP